MIRFKTMPPFLYSINQVKLMEHMGLKDVAA
jgi:hypothetical protein